MIVLRFALALILTAEPGVQSTSPGKPLTPIPAQDIDTYEKAGPYERIRGADGSFSDEQVQRIGRTREWLWAHWVSRQRALLIETSYTIEGDRSTAYYFVEPDRDGHWRTSMKVERLLYNYKFKDPDCKRFRIEEFTTYSVDRVDSTLDKSGLYPVIPQEEKRPPKDYLIRFHLREVNEYSYY